MLYLQKAIPVLQNFAQLLNQQTRLPRRSEFAAVTGVLGRLINFCSQSNETNPLRRIGIPIRDNQRLLVDQKVPLCAFSLLGDG